MIRECGEVNGLGLGDREVKISLYADDTTIFLKPDKNAVKKILDIFHWYQVVSGLSMNIDRTKMVKFGACRAK